MMKKDKFLKQFDLTEDQFTGKQEIGGSLDLRSLTSIPDGFNPTVGGYLYLSSLTSIPDGFNPTVGGYLDLSSLTSIPDGFNPTVGGSLYLRSLTSIPDGFNPTVGGSLDLRSLTSIPDGFNPTVGGSLYLSSLTSIPDGFNPTVGGSLYLSSKSKYIGASVNVEIDTNFFWNKNGKRYAIIDSLFCEILSEHKHNGTKVFNGRKIAKTETFYIVNKGKFWAHGDELNKAYEDLAFKEQAEKLRNEPINEDTVINVQHYRIITGACEMGCRCWMEQNNITQDEMKAGELLPLLKRTNAYGYERFKKLMVQ